MVAHLRPIRANKHRSLIGPEFDAGPDGIDPVGLTYADISSDPKLSALGALVFAELKEQFADGNNAAPAETTEEEKYRLRLEGWADVLETLLDETLRELEVIRQARTEEPELAFTPSGDKP